MSQPAPAARVAALNANLRATRKPTGHVTIGCPVCKCPDAHVVDVTIERGCHASASEPSESDTFDFEVPDSCPECRIAYSAPVRIEMGLAIDEEAAHQYGRSYNKIATGVI